MIEPRLASHIIVSALIRTAEAQNAFAAVLRKGDRVAGSILLLRREKGQNPTLFERFPSVEGTPVWSEVTMEVTEKERKISEYLEKRALRDPDIWILELDVPFEQRFTDIVTSLN